MFKTIIELLTRQECVIVPGFGGFVVNDRLAEIKDGRFMPSRKELVFNSRLVHNDGDLVHAIMDERSCSFEEANRIISNEVSSVWSALKNDGVFTVPDFGVFTMKSGKVAFLQKNLKVASGASFGLDDFYYPVLDKSNPRASVVSSQKGTGSTAKTTLIAAAAVLAFLLVGQPVQDVSQPNMASLIPNMVSSQSSLKSELEVKKAELDQAQSELASYKNADSDFYLITADFSNEESAYDYMRKNGASASSLLCISQHYYLTAYCAKTKEAVDSFCFSNESADWSNAYILSVSKLNDELE